MFRSETILKITKGMVYNFFVARDPIIVVILKKRNMIFSSSIDYGEVKFF